MNGQPASPQPPRPGRKRSEESRLAILAAAFDLIGEVGYGSLTVEGIAVRSGTGKQTIYRWWPSKADVLLDALATKAELYVPIPDTGSYPADLRAFLTASFALIRHPQIIEGLRALMAEAQLDPAFGERFRESFLQPRREALGAVLQRAQQRGELPDGLSADTITDIVFGTIWYRLLAIRKPFDAQLVEELTSALT
ncbi:TetR family transcriptional regulator [Kitasatospora sp. MMS16-BH015]|uniref:TetR/AcrR family transcriptional regulator n=1 Tax=Kitasatospora sp. MMS16-BH015 TaxID=2018025 RepID=UPI000CA1080C|nr:TetR/AcrR family transcriptional regulator [Kitasatospora sp. MMS16-BH015]AUG78016.1 TetR family transcriptional regulator [Kitasatospora sp. MMS16-BH015]